eukprot:TRINITY_DN43816_c0_g1_i1.p1 TRINITY_DN43816_c0_g1~~TRINITY_DN43816_c0_g1_i1.p1  ORF type:complete len:263 (+),score=29.33 TRINITY_DN43816_c0_g1_i1:74-862(+)
MMRGRVQSISPVRRGGYEVRSGFREISPMKVMLTPPPVRGRRDQTLLEKVTDVAKLQDRLEVLLKMQGERGRQPGGRDISDAILVVEENLVKAAKECEEAVSPRSPPPKISSYTPLLSPTLSDIPPPVPLVPPSLQPAVESLTTSRPLTHVAIHTARGSESFLLRSIKDPRMSFIVVKPAIIARGLLEHRHVEDALLTADNEKAAGVVIVLPTDCFIDDRACGALASSNTEVVFQNSAFPFTLGKAVDSVATTATLACMRKM